MVEIETIFIQSNQVKLEAEYFQSNKNLKNISVLITHPHPQFGGDMYNNVVSAIFKGFIHKDISCLRFNFRGVGQSKGSHTEGKGELNDVKASIDYLLNERGNENLFLCGYSYGAAIGCSLINHSDKIIAYAAVSFPWDFMGEKYKSLSQSPKPKLFIQGDNDNIASFARFELHFNDYQNPKEYKIISGADHFYWGYETQVAKIVLDFLFSLI
ncbi:MAG: alpha/beta hydrolase [Candidatus Thorarchaeota archaeon]